MIKDTYHSVYVAVKDILEGKEEACEDTLLILRCIVKTLYGPDFYKIRARVRHSFERTAVAGALVRCTIRVPERKKNYVPPSLHTSDVLAHATVLTDQKPLADQLSHAYEPDMDVIKAQARKLGRKATLAGIALFGDVAQEYSKQRRRKVISSETKQFQKKRAGLETSERN